MLSAIIVAAGSSRRMGFDKLFASLKGKPVIAHTISAFEKTASVNEIIIVGREDRLGQLEELAHKEEWKKFRRIRAGGARRQDSVKIGLEELADGASYVAVHDAARPFIRPELIERIYTAAQVHQAAAPGVPVNDTLKRVDADRLVTGSVSRENVWAVQTPQIFKRELLIRAYEAVSNSGLDITDEVSAVQHLGEKIALIPNDQPNLKITHAADLALAEMLLTTVIS